MSIFDDLQLRVFNEFQKEYLCHLRYVHEIAVELQREHGGDLFIIEIASILHDIGGVSSLTSSKHAEFGSMIVPDWLNEYNLPFDTVLAISDCIKMHDKVYGHKTIEEEIVATADNLSRLKYHDMFMLMCDEEGFFERAKWGLRHIEDGYRRLALPAVMEANTPLYESLVGEFRGIVEAAACGRLDV